ncbi:unnamed protein product [Polarella glacialis]|uniref:Uncharacterized protein n=1 Tax=Polarella glacialis TaxID=89957 RepID=A0A813JHE7_POLGL|nr:unnamed protein product [Polarella glacialis]CAE8675369.1 unnamed protein product [Polarella glacialis]|mmetsp:Transcript_25653/g.41105  ORF Transcript_25653/g.41105 Transcript_25653/m.41105 type:complete len:121 (-) Transcript_25653:16-378(-)|eukprot:CAMPEP_0115109678 /NCGR_PEP_ID=MMETSP0227-20121206/38878_1 /TAXON_ID=89957 /ORGANISM="Polarella glacialis, Strain CCMP 1383" /LENGTH=120 /DNA_ID=CAMNT_0002508481 /DNA_START=65 /DNA_END=427 /DNA_ORIENTATION=+
MADGEGFFATMFGGAKPKTAQEMKDEKYVQQMVSLNKVLDDWHNKTVSNSEALKLADHYMLNIEGIGSVDGENATALMRERGLDDQRRVDLQRLYQDLKKACGQKAPDYGTHHKQKSGCC